MTVTESAPATETDTAVATTPVEVPGLAAVIGSGDHKVVGRLWIVAALVHLLLAGAAGSALSIERFDIAEEGSFLASDWVAQIYTFHSISAAFLFLLPLTVGVAIAIVPLQVGAPTLAFPRAAAAAFWAYLVGSGLTVGAYAIDGGPFGADADGVALFVVGLGLVIAALVVAWICVATTVVALRIPGLTMSRVPLFAWSALVSAAVWLLTLPVLGAMLVIVYLDHTYGGAGGAFGGAGSIYHRLAWAFGQPAVYAFAIPVLGVAASVVPVLAATRHRQHRVAMVAIGAYGALSIGAWAMPTFTAGGEPGVPWLYEGPWIAVSFAILLPVLVLAGLWADTARRGRLTLASPLIYAAAAVLMLLVGLLAGAVQAIEPLEVIDGDASLYGTTWTTSVAHYVLLAATIALFGAVTWWATKVLGRAVADGLQKVVALLLLAGTVVLAFPELIAGLLGQSMRLGGSMTGSNVDAVEGLNIAAAAGGVLLLVGALLYVVGLVHGLVSGDRPGDDPWSGHTLEWATSSPPPPTNFVTLPEISSEAPLYDARHREEATA